MARVTVEDCIVQVPNRFELVLLAAQRAKQITSGNPLTVDRDNDKDAVVSLREIADQTIGLDQLHENLVQTFFKRPISDITDQKLLSTEEEEETAVPVDVEEAFKDAAGHIDVKPDEGQDSGMSFGDEDIQADD